MNDKYVVKLKVDEENYFKIRKEYCHCMELVSKPKTKTERIMAELTGWSCSIIKIEEIYAGRCKIVMKRNYRHWQSLLDKLLRCDMVFDCRQDYRVDCNNFIIKFDMDEFIKKVIK